MKKKAGNRTDGGHLTKRIPTESMATIVRRTCYVEVVVRNSDIKV